VNRKAPGPGYYEVNADIESKFSTKFPDAPATGFGYSKKQSIFVSKKNGK